MTDFLVINKPKTKSEIRRHLKKQTLNFLAGGGEVEIIPKGSSAHDIGEEPPWLKNMYFTMLLQAGQPLEDHLGCHIVQKHRILRQNQGSPVPHC